MKAKIDTSKVFWLGKLGYLSDIYVSENLSILWMNDSGYRFFGNKYN